MNAVREVWTDERLDDLNHRLERSLGRIDVDLRALRSETNAEFAALRGEMNARFDGVDSRFEAMRNMILQVGGGIVVTLMVGFLGLIATQL